MKKKVIILLILWQFSFLIYGGEFQIGGSFGLYSKNHDLFQKLYGKNGGIFGLEVSYYFLKDLGLFVEASYFNKTGASSYLENDLKYNEFHFIPGVKLRFKLLQFSETDKLNLYFKAGGLFIRYSENFDKNYSDNIYGILIGGGLVLWIKKIGVALELSGNIANKKIEIQGLDKTENVSFSGIRIAIKGIIKL